MSQKLFKLSIIIYLEILKMAKQKKYTVLTIQKLIHFQKQLRLQIIISYLTKMGQHRF